MRNSTFFSQSGIFLSLFFTGCNHILFSQTFNGQGNMLVPPGAPSQTVGITQSPCSVSGVGVLGGCNQIDHVDINLNHTWDGDIALFLIGPGGQVIELSSGNGGAGDNFTNTVFTDNTGPFITSGSPPYTGTFRPEGRQQSTTPPFPNTNPLGTHTFANTFNGTNADGEWLFMVNDYVAADWGEIISWSITFSGGGTSPTVTLGAAPSPICAGQSSTLTLTFSQPTPPGVSYDGVIEISTGSSLLLNDIVPSGLTWTIPVFPTTTWTFTLVSLTSNGGGCQPIIGTPSSATVVVNPTPMASISGDLSICAGESTTLTASGGGTYSWSNGSSSDAITVTPSASQSYSVTVSDNGCSSQTTIFVAVNPLPTITLSALPDLCEGDCATIIATLSGSAPFFFSYEFQAGGNLIGPGGTFGAGSTTFPFLACPPAGSPTPLQVVICTLSDSNCSL